MAEPTWMEGRAAGDGAVLARVKVTWSGQDETPPPTATGRTFQLTTDAGDRVTVEVGPDTVVAPERSERGPWREILAHATRPEAAKTLHPDGEVALEGAWILGGERVAVLGHVTDQEFVPGTGGPRESPEARPSAIAALAIGVGDQPRRAAEDALAERERATKRAAAAGSLWGWLEQPRHLAPMFAVVALAWLPLGAYGTALMFFHLAVLWTWVAVPCRDFPGGAAGDDDRTKAVIIALMSTLFAPMLVGLTLALGPMSGNALRRSDALIAAMLTFGILLELLTIARALLARPRAEDGFQLELPASRGLRVALVTVLVATMVGCAVWAATVHDFTSDGAGAI